MKEKEWTDEEIIKLLNEATEALSKRTKIKMGYVGDQNSPLPIRDSVGTEELP